jgi:hypothetical protein
MSAGLFPAAGRTVPLPDDVEPLDPAQLAEWASGWGISVVDYARAIPGRVCLFPEPQAPHLATAVRVADGWVTALRSDGMLIVWPLGVEPAETLLTAQIDGWGSSDHDLRAQVCAAVIMCRLLSVRAEDGGGVVMPLPSSPPPPPPDDDGELLPLAPAAETPTRQRRRWWQR